MKLYHVLICLMILALLAGCAPAGGTGETTDPTTSNTQPTNTPTDAPTEPTAAPTQPTTAPTELATEPATEPTTEPTVPMLGIRNEYNEVKVYPCAEEDISLAKNVLMAALNTYEDKDEVLDFQIHWLAFDPIYTDFHIQGQIAGTPVEGWTEDDYYANTMYFVINYSVSYDHTLSPANDYNYQNGVVALTRESVDSPWQLDSASCMESIPNLVSNSILPPEILQGLALTHEFALSGYYDGEYEEYILYILDEDTKTVVCRSFNAAKVD